MTMIKRMARYEAERQNQSSERSRASCTIGASTGALRITMRKQSAEPDYTVNKADLHALLCATAYNPQLPIHIPHYLR